MALRERVNRDRVIDIVAMVIISVDILETDSEGDTAVTESCQ
jgi:hypothetical protein